MPIRNIASSSLFSIAAVFVAAAATSGCFNPKIVDGGLVCADGGLCPDGFYCAADGTCKEGSAMTCQAASPHIQPICTPDPGHDCDPVCQSRCDCGRCTLSETKLTCVAPGTKKRGVICTPGADDCEPGNVCVPDCDGAIGRCYRFCGKGSVRHAELCDVGQDCDFPVTDANQGPTDLWACPAPMKTCGPAGDGSDCGNPALACYLAGNGVATVCECKGKKPPNDPCSFFNSCVPGYRCVAISTINGGAPTCLKTCSLAGNDCPSGTCSMIGGSTFGFCPP